jgi:hypothetical protein
MWQRAAAILLALTAPATAATWTCPRRTEIMPTTALLVYCRASGTYTTGGDPLADDKMDLCNSENRLPIDAVVSTAASAITGEGYVVAYKPGRILLLTASPSPGKGQALIELDNGTLIEGAIFSAFVVCK